jgi:hypothetical protein
MIQSIQIRAYQFAFLDAASDAWPSRPDFDMQRFEAFLWKFHFSRHKNADF